LTASQISDLTEKLNLVKSTVRTHEIFRYLQINIVVELLDRLIKEGQNSLEYIDAPQLKKLAAMKVFRKKLIKEREVRI